MARGLLEKYDEEAPDDGMQIGESGVVADERTARLQEIRRKLAAGERAARLPLSVAPFHTCRMLPVSLQRLGRTLAHSIVRSEARQAWHARRVCSPLGCASCLVCASCASVSTCPIRMPQVPRIEACTQLTQGSVNPVT